MKRQPKGMLCKAGFVGIAILAVAVAAGLVSTPMRTSAGTLNTSIVGMFPKNVGEFAYADLKAARKLTWFPQVREQILPSRFRDFEKFLTSAGIDPNTQVEEMAWGGITVGKSGEEIVGVALGNFDPSSTEARFKAQKMPMTELRGYHIFTFGSGTGSNDIQFFFIDSNTAAFGHRPALEKLIGVRFGDSESLLANDTLFPLINEANGGGVIWAVLDKSYTHLAMTQLVPQVSQFPQAAAIVDRLHAMTINIDADSGVDAKLQAVCDSPDDANLLAAGLQAGLMYRRYQEASSNPDLARVLDNVHVSPTGDRLKIEVPVSEDQITSLIKSRVFAVPM
jgi:hypothetical protein